MNRLRRVLVPGVLGLSLAAGALGVPARASGVTRQEVTETEALARVQQVVRSAQSSLARYRRAGGEAGGKDHPGAEWAQRVWAMRDQSPGEASAVAAAEALRLWGQAGRWQEVATRVRGLEIDDGAWRRVFLVLEDQSRTTGDSSLLREQGDRALAAWPDADRRAGLHSLLGRVAQSAGDLVAARGHYDAVRSEAPGSELAAEAEGHLYELTELQPGQPAPSFEGTARDGSTVSLEALRGHPVLILFWASW